jgi:outer membrane protein assembly factor BamB
MTYHDDNFTPETVDEQIERLVQGRIQGQSEELDAHLVEVLQQIYQADASPSLADQDSLERIKRRIERASREGQRLHDAPGGWVELQGYEKERRKRMNISPGATKISPLYRGFTVLAAVAIIAVLLGSWVIISNREAQQATLQRNVNTSAGNQQPDVYVLLSRTIYKLNAKNGAIIWKSQLTGRGQNGYSAAIKYADGVVYSTNNDGIDAFDARKGTPLWHVSGVLAETETTHIQVANGFIYGFRGRSLVALDAKNGSQRWSANLSDNQPDLLYIKEGTAYVMNNTDELYAFNAFTGAVRWHYQEYRTQHYSVVEQVNGIVYSAHEQALYAFKVGDGSLLWQKTLTNGQAFHSISIVGGVLYADSNGIGDPGVFTADSYVYAFNTQNGSMLWTSGKGYGLEDGLPIFNGVVLAKNQHITNGAATTIQTALTGLDARTGKQIWRDNGDLMLLAVANGVAYAAESGTHPLLYMVAFDLKTGKMLALHPFTSNLVFSYSYDLNSTALDQAYNRITYEIVQTQNPGKQPDVAQAIDVTNGKILWRCKLENTEGNYAGQLIVTH